MGLPWVRLDSNVASHDKMLWLIDQPGGWRASTVYLFSLGWSGGQGTDGHIPTHAVRAVHADKRTVELLVAGKFWEPCPNGWMIRHYQDRQELAVVSDAKRSSARLGARKTNCSRYHAPGCECWKEDTEPERKRAALRSL